MAKKYFVEVEHIHSVKPFLNTQTYAALLSDLGDVCCDLGDLNEAVIYAQKALKLWQTLSNSTPFIADNLKNIGIAYSEKNDFKNAALYFNLAIDKLANIKGQEELLSNIYGRLGTLYAVTFLNSQKAEIAEKYVQKGLNILGASKKYYQTSPSSQKLSCEAVRNKTRLGEVYNRLGRFDDALLNGFNEAQYLIDQHFDNCLHNLTKARILLGKGEAFLRLGKLKEAEKHLTSALNLARIIIGEGDSLKIKALRAEAYVGLGKLQEAYEDCLAGFKLEKKRVDNHSRLLYAILFYHAAVIKGLKNEHDKAIEYFKQFFAEIKSFCKSYLTEKDYDSLIKSGAFEISKPSEQSVYNKLHAAHINSRIIFTMIYGHNHPFLKDYVIKNSHEIFQFG